jgi:alpha-L-fucosidase
MKASHLALLLVLTSASQAQQYVDTAARTNSRTTNDPKAVETFRDRGLGLFIHWGVDGVLGGVISHSLVGASPDFQNRFFKLLPGYFDPYRFEPDRWAALAKLAGFR